MCFSASASFGAAALIGTAGVVAYKKANTPSTRPFAAIPILFAIQQFFEGCLWLSLSQPFATGSEFWTIFCTYGFLVFAWVIWPFYVPYSLRMMERKTKRKNILIILLGIGAALSTLLTVVLIRHGVSASISQNHIAYKINLTFGFGWLISILYLLSTVFSCFVSSVKKVSIFGVYNLTSFLLIKWFFNEHVISVWCFFAAVMSILVVMIVYEQEKFSTPSSIQNPDAN